jgi:hypothetical protein
VHEIVQNRADRRLLPFHEQSLLHLQDLAFRARPVVRKILEWGARGNTVFGISFFGIVDVGAFETLPAGVTFFLFFDRHEKYWFFKVMKVVEKKLVQ